jgi:hypothetical protein
MRKLLIALFLAALIAYPVLCHFQWQESYRCNYCFAGKTITEWRLGIQPLGYPLFGHEPDFTRRSIRLTDPVEHFTPSVAESLFPPEHRHEWVFAGANPYYLFGKRWGGCLLGPPARVSPFAYAFMNNEDFRRYIEQLVRTGELSQSEAVSLFVFQPKTDPRYTRSIRLVRDFLAKHPNRVFQETFDSGYGGA